MEEKYTQEERAEERAEVFFEIRETGEFSDKQLQREFGRLILRRRPLWAKLSEALSVGCIALMAIYAFEIGSKPDGEFRLAPYIADIAFPLAAACAVVAALCIAYHFLLRPGVVGRKRLAPMQAEQSTIRFYADRIVSTAGEQRMELPYAELPWDFIYVGERALYLGVRKLAFFSVLPRDSFTVGESDFFPAFMREKTDMLIRRIV